MKKRLFILVSLLLAVLLLTACGAKKEAATPAPAVTADAFLQATPAPTAAPTPVQYATVPPAPTPVQYATVPPAPMQYATVPPAQPTPVPVITAAPVQNAQSNLPRITKNPTDETVPAYGSCQFVTRYENAELAEWHFVSADGTLDVTYQAVQTQFPSMNVIGGNTKDLTLENIPEALNGCRVYCRFSNYAGSVNTGSARITVLPAQNPVVPAQPQRAGFSGRWAEEIAGRGLVEIGYPGDNGMHVEISWSSSAWQLARWQMTARVYSDDVLTYADGHCWVENYDNNGVYTVTDESFGATGTFYMRDGKLHWHNDQTGEDSTFIPA